MLEKIKQFGLTGNLEIGEAVTDIEINTVIGFSGAKLLPARYFLGVLSACNLAESLQIENTSVQPTVRVILPMKIAEFTNGINPSSIATQRETVGKGLRVIKELFPGITLIADEDKPITEGTLALLEESAQNIAVDDAILESLRESGQKWGGRRGRENALLYVGQHPFAWRDRFDARIFHHPTHDITINLLPVSEGRFSAVRRSVREAQNSSPITNLQELSLGACPIPNYLPVDDKEPHLFSNIPLWQVALLYQSLAHSDNETYVGTLQSANYRKAARDFEIVMRLLVAKKGDGIKNCSLREIFGL